MRSTVQDVLLQAGAALSQPFHESDLCIAAWRLSPKAIGARTRETVIPDLNRVRVAVIGKRGLVERRYFEKVAPLTYRLTKIGRHRLHELRHEPAKLVDEDCDEVLLKVKEAAGQWVDISTHSCHGTALDAADLWEDYCGAAKWQAFEFRAVGIRLSARFVGTVIVPTARRSQALPQRGE